MVNFNNPQNLDLSDSYSTVSATLNNPFVEYGDFRTADPTLTNILPKQINLGNNNGNANDSKDVLDKTNNNLNLGLTSPGFIDNAYKCTGLDFINTNPDYDNLTFQTCLNKFEKEFRIPELTFNNLLNNLPYTFSALTNEDKKRFLDNLQNFINNERNNEINNDSKKNNKKEKVKNSPQVKEYMKNDNDNDNECVSSTLSLTAILTLIIIPLFIIVFVIYLTKKN